MNLTVACVFVRGHVGFTPDYVFKLRSVVSRYLPHHRFVCLTDQPESLPGIETVRIATPVGHFAWWAKLELFNSAHEPLRHGRIMYFDLDTLAIDRLEPIAMFSPGLSLVPDDAPNFTGKGKLKTVKRFNSSVMSWSAGTCDRLYTEWTPAVAQRLWGDQDWIGEQMPDATTMPLAWFPRLSQITTKGQVESRMKFARVILCKKPKNVEAARQWPWFAREWQ